VLAPLLVVAALAATTGTAAAAPALTAASALPAVLAAAASDPAPNPAPNPAPGPGAVGIRLMEAPAAAVNDPRAHTYIVDHLSPGAVISRKIEISNTTRQIQHVSLYAGEADIKDGSFLAAEGRNQNDLARWTKMSQPELDVAPGVKIPVVATVTIPKDAAPGEQYAAIWAEIGNPVPGIKVVNRVGVRMYVDVGGANPAPTSFTLDTLTALRGEDGRPGVSVQIHNDGGRALDLTGEMRLSDGPGSLAAGPFPGQLGKSTLAPGQSLSMIIPLDPKLPNGPWKASVSVKSGTVERHAEGTIEFPSGPGSSEPVSLNGDLTAWLPLGIGLLVLLVVLAIGAGVLIGRRRAHRSTD
jgi:hypothetical protein